MALKNFALHALTLVGLVVSLIGPRVATPVQAAPMQASVISFTGEELLGRPTDTSITVNIVPDAPVEYYYEYGTLSGNYTAQTSLATATANQPHEIVISGLEPNTRYFYRMRYHAPGDAMDDWVVRDEHTFHTQRPTGEGFVFTVTSDSHATFNASHRQAMTNVLNDQPDFHIDLGDTFYSSNASSQSAVNNAYLAYREPAYMDRIGHSVPIFLTAGNHEDEEGWNLDDTPFSPAVGSIQARKAYYPTPIDEGPGGFYSGNTNTLAAIDEAIYGDEYREDYYAWEWGDALFVVIDEFQYTVDLPYPPAAGEGNDDSVTGDQWSWTLGAQQFNWLKQTLENSDAKYKFVFSHNMLGGITRSIVGVGAGYVRGGAEAAAYFEWGGNNADGSWGFDTHRPGWGGVPIHQLMVENGVSAYFHGHDHQYVYETRDGIVYQEVPSPSMTGSGFSGIYTEGNYGDYSTIEMLPNSGHLRVTVTPDEATVEYVRSNITAVSHSYTILPNTPSTTYDLTVAVDPGGSGTTDPAMGVHTFDENEIVTITATPAAGYIFDHWTGDVTNPYSTSTTVTMDANKSVTAVFVENTPTCYALTRDHTGQGSDPAATPANSTGCPADQYVEGASINLSGATPSTGWHIAGWTGTGDDSSTAASNSLTMPANAHTVSVTYMRDTVTLSVDVTGSGSVTRKPSGPYLYGDQAQLTAVPAPGWHFDHWTGDLSGSDNPATLTLNGNKCVTAHFTQRVNFLPIIRK